MRLEPKARIELAACRLRNGCSATKLLRRRASQIRFYRHLIIAENKCFFNARFFLSNKINYQAGPRNL